MRLGRDGNERLICVAPDHVEKIWPHVSRFIEAAYWRAGGDDDIEAVKADLDAQRSLLWVVWDGQEIIAVATTTLLQLPMKKVCLLSSCAGKDLARWQHFIADIEQYARDEKCNAVRVMGRRGWKAILPDYREPWICLEKTLSD